MPSAPTVDTPRVPPRLAISMWDFSWYTRTGPGEPFEDLDRAVAEAVERGFNCVRLCAMPFLLFGDHDIDTSNLTFTNFGGDYAQGLRWYDVAGPATIDGKAHLLDLFEAAERHGLHIILSSWEYQQSPSFFVDDRWNRALFEVPAAKRASVLAECMAQTVDLVKQYGFGDRIAFVEIHNEVTGSSLLEYPRWSVPLPALQPVLEGALDLFQARHPDLLSCASYPELPVGSLRYLPRNQQVAQFHCYIYGVLEALLDEIGLHTYDGFREDVARRLVLREDAPSWDGYLPSEDNRWRLDGTMIPPHYIYVHDWVDAEKWDRWLYENYGRFAIDMRRRQELLLRAGSDYAQSAGVPAIIGEGWVGYTARNAEFEDGPVGREFLERGLSLSRELGYWGAITASNAAPPHELWRDKDYLSRVNRQFLAP